MKAMATAAMPAAVLVLASLSGVAAAGPAVRACLGQDMSHYARDGVTVFGQTVEPGSGFGHFHYDFAQVVFHGMGEPTLLHMSGGVPEGALDSYACGG